MDRLKMSDIYHKQGFNCCQSVVAVFSDLMDVNQQTCFDVAAGFGNGAGTGELCGAAVGAMMALGLMTPVDTADPVSSKKRTTKLSKEFQKRFYERFCAVRCCDLLKNAAVREDPVSERIKALGLTNHCDIMVASAVEIVEEMLAERGNI